MKLSIITINLNNSTGLSRTIESVLNQTFRDYEYIIIDGASKDDSLTIINSHRSEIAFVVSQPDSGIYNAMNKGIKIATGEYCLFLNSGDYLESNSVLENVFNSCLGEDLLIGSVLLTGKDKQELFEIPDIKDLTFRYFLTSTIPHPGTFIKRDLFNILGLYNEKNILASDWEFFLIAIFKYRATMKKLPETISVFDWNGLSSLPENADGLLRERDQVLKRHFQRFLPDYEYLEKLRLSNIDLGYQASHNFWFLIRRILKRIRN